ncbi:MAG: hypothetical protein U0M23_07100 [Acutalibacteraceae bacterium]|nr:hypothetical protein [Acutalibacteraceae bacterium]HIR02653.1 hypothetical protein [Candidatus Scatovicinus merdipullorum]
MINKYIERNVNNICYKMLQKTIVAAFLKQCERLQAIKSQRKEKAQKILFKIPYNSIK